MNSSIPLPSKKSLAFLDLTRTLAILICLSFGIGIYDAEAKIPLNSFKGVTDCFMKDKKYFSPTLGMAALDGGLIENLRFYGNFIPAEKDRPLSFEKRETIAKDVLSGIKAAYANNSNLDLTKFTESYNNEINTLHMNFYGERLKKCHDIVAGIPKEYAKLYQGSLDDLINISQQKLSAIVITPNNVSQDPYEHLMAELTKNILDNIKVSNENFNEETAYNPLALYKEAAKTQNSPAKDSFIGLMASLNKSLNDLLTTHGLAPNPSYDLVENYKNKKPKERDYENDKSADPIFTMTKILFPSTAGQLSGESRHPFNFGSKVKNPQAIALLFKFTNDVRSGNEVDMKATLGNFINILVPSNSELTPETKQLQTILQQNINGIKIKDGLKDKNAISKFLSEEIHKIMKEKLQDNKAGPTLYTKIKTSMGQAKCPSFSNESCLEILKKASITAIELYFKEQTEKPIEEFKKRLIKSTLEPLLASIQTSIQNELSDANPFYPKYTPEQIISAFFCYKFNNRGDIKELFDNIKDINMDIINNESISFNQKDILTVEDIEAIAQNSQPTLDDIFALEIADLFFMPTPYRVGASMISNAEAKKYDRKMNEFVGGTFADCADVGIRHLTNFFLYDNQNKNFNYSALERYQQQQTLSPGQLANFKAFMNFYTIQTPNLVNDGSSPMRDLWNTVVGDLNADDGSSETRVRYANADGRNELDTGFINLMRVFHKVLGVKFEQPPLPDATPEAISEWVEKSFQEIFKALNPNEGHTIEVDATNAKYKNVDVRGKTKDILDIFGTVYFKINDQQGEMLYSFDLKSGQGHAEIEGYDVDPELRISRDQGLLGINFSLTGSENAIWLLSQNKQLRTSKIAQSPLLYQLFEAPLTDNTAKIEFLRTLERMGGNEVQFGRLKQFQAPKPLKGIISNVLKELSWEDQDTLLQVSPILLNLLPLYAESLKNYKYKISLTNANDKQIVNYLKSFPNIDVLNLSYNQIIRHLSVENLLNLKELNLVYSNVQKIDGLDQLMALENLNLSSTKALKEISLKNLSNLKVLDLAYSKAQKIELDKLMALKELNLVNTDFLKEISLKNIPNLKDLDLRSSKVQKIELDQLMALEELNLRNLYALDEVSLRNLPNLKELKLTSSRVQKIKLDQLVTLEELNLDDTELLNKISFGNLPSLKRLNLSASTIQKIDGLNQLIALEDLKLASTKSLNEVSLGNLPNLKVLSLENSYIQKINGIDQLIALEELNLGNTQFSKEISLRNLSHLKEISLSNSNVQKIELDQLRVLKKLNLAHTQFLKEISLGNLPNLEELNMAYSNIQKIDGLDQLMALENLNLRGTKALKEISFGNLPNLKVLSLENSNIQKINGLNQLIALEELNLGNTQFLKEILFGYFHNLMNLNLEDSKLQKIDGLTPELGQILETASSNYSTTEILQKLGIIQ